MINFANSMAISKIIGQNKNLGKNMFLSPFVGHDLVKRELGRIKTLNETWKTEVQCPS